MNRARGDIYVWWIIAMPIIILILAMVIELGRYMMLRSQVQTAADAASLAAAAQIDIPAYQNGQGVHFTSQAYSTARVFMERNCEPLIARGGNCYLLDVEFDEGIDRVKVTVGSDLSMFFPSFIPQIVIKMYGYSQVAPFSD